MLSNNVSMPGQKVKVTSESWDVAPMNEGDLTVYSLTLNIENLSQMLSYETD